MKREKSLNYLALAGLWLGRPTCHSLHGHNYKYRDNIPTILLTQYCAGDKIEKNEVGGTCNVDGEGRGVYGALVGKFEGKKPLGRPRCR
jgi:hypothetical protein